MAYNAMFFKLYANYLAEPLVRHNHDQVFKKFFDFAALPNAHPRIVAAVIDFGCGLGEFEWRGCPGWYVGVDRRKARPFEHFIKADYHDLEKVAVRLPFPPNIFTSLFSIEITHSAKKKYAFYETIFDRFPSIRYGLVGGFFYANRHHKEKVREAGGVVSWQTIEDPALHISLTFDEYRLHITTPSAMFGPDVVEVWKFFARR